MIDFASVRAGQQTLAVAAGSTSHDDLVALVDQTFDTVEQIIGGAGDADVVRVPRDPAQPDEPGWTLGHVIVHLTAGLEESAALGATLARGIPVEGRSRYETPWETVTTIVQVRQRLRESRRICQAFLQAWPDQPHLDLTVTIPVPIFGPLNAVGYSTVGPFHAEGHFEQLREIMRQAS